jgi:hypothetical protein
MTFRVKPIAEGVPETQSRPWSSTAFNEGAPLIVHTDGSFREAGADPSTIAAFALHDVGTGSGAEFPIGTREFPPGQAQATLARAGLKLIAEFVGTPAEGTFGCVRGADGRWRVDFTETTVMQFRFVRRYDVAPLSQPLVEVSLLAAAVAIV